jgi:maltose alpha-D-glucosyltransferase/alpha-amylase
MTWQPEGGALITPHGHILDLAREATPQEVFDKIGNYLEAARVLGQRTAELHILLASAGDDPIFAPEPFSKLYQRALYQSMRTLVKQVFGLLRRRIKSLPETVRSDGEEVLNQQPKILAVFEKVLGKKITAMRLRCHGDFHLGQVLNTGKDFVIMDFEGEPARPVGERRIKRSPLRDVAGMLRSFHYADYSALFSLQERGLLGPEDFASMECWGQFWHLWVCVAFLRAYLDTADDSNFLPRMEEELQMLLDLYLMEKAVYELGYELNNRPDWVNIPLQGIRQLLGHQTSVDA